MEVTDYTDEQLIAMIRSNDDGARRAALEQIYLSAYEEAMRRILARGGKSEDADEAVTDAVIVLNKNIRNGKYKPIEGVPLKKYFLGVCYWQWRSGRDTDNHYVLPGDDGMFDRPEFRTPEVTMMDDELKEAVRKLLKAEALGDRCREVLKLWALRYTLEEIAQIMNTTYGYAQQLTFDCRNKLKKILEKKPALLKKLRDML